MGERKHITVELEQYLRERIAQHNDNLYGWLSGGYLVPTEPCPQERSKVVAELFAARYELVKLLVGWGNGDEELLLRLTIANDGDQGIVAIAPQYRVTKRA